MAEDETPDERRRYARHPGPFDGWCVGRELEPLRVMNLGLGGCFIAGHFRRPVGDTFLLRIDLDDDGVLEVSATSLYHTMNGSAVTFVNLNQAAFNLIRRTVAASWAQEAPVK